ncbi:hypothetical protein [Paenibacillus sanguinis]|uniref:hypothetical protein n=1 Tax=Paenibacillus sanguinis TaxID=225906 RepID=UPI00037F945E|nr:hypothetical protein [Paenibacillus sanguinis]
MEMSEEKLEWRTVKEAFRRYRENEELLKRLQNEQPDQYQLGFALAADGQLDVVADYVLDAKSAKAYNEAVMSCIRQLSSAEQRIIKAFYLSPVRLPPWRIYEQELHIGRTLYFTTKAKAVGKLFVLLRAKNLVPRHALPP